ncbi:MAG TPA: hypothetical protein VGM98_00830 [Schlesneria sp.]|jgi:hypothetical protein
MHTFFHGWRRKAGVVALVMSCALMGGWLNSLYLANIVRGVILDCGVVLDSENGYLDKSLTWPKGDSDLLKDFAWGWNSRKAFADGPSGLYLYGFAYHYDGEALYLYVGIGQPPVTALRIVVPYWSLVAGIDIGYTGSSPT